MHGPEALRFCFVLFSGGWVGHVDERFEGFVVWGWMVWCEGDVVGWVPVLGSDTDCEGREVEEVVDQGGDCAATFDGEGATLVYLY